MIKPEYYLLKSTIQKLFGNKAWVELKDTSSLKIWKKYLTKTLDATLVSIRESIDVYDQNWLEPIEENIRIGKLRLKESKDIDESISIVCAVFIEQSFLQIGFMPNRKGIDQVNLRKKNWNFDCFRSVIIVQNSEQIETEFWSTQQKEIGFEQQLKLKKEHRLSKSKLCYSEWCKNN